jgi:hypothetical protein
MAKRRVGTQTVSLTPDQKKSGIDPIYLAANDVPHTVGNLLTRAITLLLAVPQSKVCLQSYVAPQSRESMLARFWDSHLGVPGERSHLDGAPWRGPKYTIKGKVVASPKSRPW